MGICIPENYNSPPTGEVLAMQTPKNLPVAKPGVSGALHNFPSRVRDLSQCSHSGCKLVSPVGGESMECCIGI